ncbi:MAG TPA: histidine kinase [Nocardioidaceae bacterium]|nr:histidine kinase [Nocardioidaceae bacterium]
MLGLAVTALSQVEVWWYGAAGGGLAAGLTLGAAGASLSWRGVRPVLTTVAVNVWLFACATTAGEPFSATSVIATTVAFFSVGAMRNRVLSVLTLAAAAVAGVAETQPLTLNNYLAIVLSSFAVPWLLGLLWLHRRTTVEERRRQEGAAAEALHQERLRLARELHDVVSHNVGMIAVQAGAADVTLDRDPAESRRSLHTIEAGARTTLLELRRLLGLLRDDGEGPAPRPVTLAELDAIIAPLTAAGIDVSLHRTGPAGPLGRDVDLTAYRIVQEALTNVVAHAGPCRVEVTVSEGSEGLRIEVADDGRSGHGSARGGYGLVGLRERVGALGGTFAAGPRPGGGFLVAATIPVTR